MKVQALPDYSAERYYLLSEIEQKARFILLDEVEDSDSDSLHTLYPINFYYVRWRPSMEDSACLIQKVRGLLDRVPNVRSSNKLKNDNRISSEASGSLQKSQVILVIEAFLNKKGDWNEEMQRQLREIMDRFEKEFQTKHIIIGLTDFTGGTPALEKCHDMIESLLPGYENMTIIADFVANQRVDMLGLDPNMEPDAQSQVFQLLCLPDDETLATLEEDAKQKVSTFLTKQRKVKSNSSSALSQIAVSFAFVALFAAFLAYLAKQKGLF